MNKDKPKLIFTRKADKMQLVLAVFITLTLLVISACHMSTTEPEIAEPLPITNPGPEPVSEPVPEPTTEPTPEPKLIEAKRTDLFAELNGIPASLVIYEIDEHMFLDIFELAAELSGTEKQFYPAWAESTKTLQITRDIPYLIGMLRSSTIDSDNFSVIQGDITMFLDGNEVFIYAFRTGGDILVDFIEITTALDLITDHDPEEDSISIFTSQAIADKISQKGDIDPSLPMVALTFDDGPAGLTDPLLDILEEHGAVATFYVLGMQIDRYRETLQRAFDMGCEIANHTWSHRWLDRISIDNIQTQLNDTSALIEEVVGVSPSNMRPPYGSYNEDVQNVARELGLSIILWSIDPSDYLNRTPDRIYNDIISIVQDKDIILLHDIHERSIAATRRLVPSLIEKGFQLVTVSDLMYFSGITPQPGEVYRHAR